MEASVNKRLILIGSTMATVLFLVSSQSGQTARQTGASTTPPATAPVNAPKPAFGSTNARALLDLYCVNCHNVDDNIANLHLDELNVNRVPQNAETFEKVVRKLRAGMMPPTGAPRPDDATREAMTRWMETELD